MMAPGPVCKTPVHLPEDLDLCIAPDPTFSTYIRAFYQKRKANQKKKTRDSRNKEIEKKGKKKNSKGKQKERKCTWKRESEREKKVRGINQTEDQLGQRRKV